LLNTMRHTILFGITSETRSPISIAALLLINAP